MWPKSMSSVATHVAGEISLKSIDPWRTIGNSTIMPKRHRNSEFSRGVAKGIRRAAKTARKVARMHGTPVYFWKNGRVVAEKP